MNFKFILKDLDEAEMLINQRKGDWLANKVAAKVDPHVNRLHIYN